jgi:hypothetical protein
MSAAAGAASGGTPQTANRATVEALIQEGFILKDSVKDDPRNTCFETAGTRCAQYVKKASGGNSFLDSHFSSKAFRKAGVPQGAVGTRVNATQEQPCFYFGEAEIAQGCKAANGSEELQLDEQEAAKLAPLTNSEVYITLEKLNFFAGQELSETVRYGGSGSKRLGNGLILTVDIPFTRAAPAGAKVRCVNMPGATGTLHRPVNVGETTAYVRISMKERHSFKVTPASATNTDYGKLVIDDPTTAPAHAASTLPPPPQSDVSSAMGAALAVALPSNCFNITKIVGPVRFVVPAANVLTTDISGAVHPMISPVKMVPVGQHGMCAFPTKTRRAVWYAKFFDQLTALFYSADHADLDVRLPQLQMEVDLPTDIGVLHDLDQHIPLIQVDLRSKRHSNLHATILPVCCAACVLRYRSECRRCCSSKI